jgi:hypothetical protein
MNQQQHDEGDGLEDVGIGPIERGVPLPRAGGFLGRLRRTLERLELGMSAQLLNVSLKQERYIRQRMRITCATDRASVHCGCTE